MSSTKCERCDARIVSYERREERSEKEMQKIESLIVSGDQRILSLKRI